MYSIFLKNIPLLRMICKHINNSYFFTIFAQENHLVRAVDQAFTIYVIYLIFTKPNSGVLVALYVHLCIFVIR